MLNAYIDKNAINQIIGCLLQKPQILDDLKYKLTPDDFGDTFFKAIYAAIVNLKIQGINNISNFDIDNYLSSRPSLHKIFLQNKGVEYLEIVRNNADVENFEFYYNRVKKFTLLRELHKIGIDVSDIYNPDTLDVEEKIQQENWLDNNDIVAIMKRVEDKVNTIKTQYLDDVLSTNAQAGKGLDTLIESLKRNPEIGVPLYGGIFNTITRGARLKKFYLRSAPTGVGKTRMAIADAGYISCRYIYNTEKKEWEDTGFTEPTLFITTELELEEVQTMLLAFVSGVPEGQILNGEYYSPEEYERVKRAAQILKEAPLWIEHVPDFSLQDIESTIVKNIRNHEVKYVFFDYIHTSLKILEEITTKANGVKLREDIVLLMMATRLKDICNQYGVFIMSATQLNGEWETKDIANQNLLRGSKAIADKIDVGMIALPVMEDELEKLKPLLEKNSFTEPNLVISVYKNRRGEKDIRVWCKADMSTCRVMPLFVTDNYYRLINVKETKVLIEPETISF